jgi:uncharacterized protein (UPF0335 family)
LPGPVRADKVRAAARFRTVFVCTQNGTGEETMARGGGVAAERLKSFIERIERLEEEKSALAGDIREVYSEAKGAGFDTKVMRQIVRLRRMDDADRQEQQAILDTYKRALGLND